MADGSSPPIATVTPGHEVAIMGRNGAWVNVFANTDEHENVDPDNEPEFKDPNVTTAPVSGWIHDQGVVGPTTPNGDAILYGAAANLRGRRSSHTRQRTLPRKRICCTSAWWTTSRTRRWRRRRRFARLTSVGS